MNYLIIALLFILYTQQNLNFFIYEVNSLSEATKLCLTLCDPEDCSTPGFPVLPCLPELLKFMSIQSVMPSDHLILCHPVLLPSVFSSGLALPIRWLKY